MRPDIPPALEEKIIDAKVNLGYSSKTAFIHEAVRLRLQELGYLDPEE